jgi:Patatin-like phospholipase
MITSKTNTANRGIGFCQSGGGFSASFYHIGALARMAEMGMLRHIEIIPTVSGGPIVSAAYYLMVKNLLENNEDTDIKDAAYVKLVQDLEAHFLEAAQKNLRMRTFANPLKNMRMSLPNYSRSDAIGKLYEKYIYKPLLNVGNRRIKMRDLLIKSKDFTGDQYQLDDAAFGNSKRHYKVPILIINVTSLNSGHNWYFSATKMGEVPPRNLNIRDIDKKNHYRRVRYDEITTGESDSNLSSAVAASACVPGLFPPI